MPRSSNLDNVAPDDPIISHQPISKSKKVKSKVSATISDINQNNPNLIFRQKINEILGHTPHPLSSTLINPKVFSFEEKDDEEAVLLVLRRHWFTNVGWIITAVILAFLPGFLPLKIIFSGVSSSYQLVAVLFWYLITFVFSFEKFLSWYFNVYIVTDERVVDIDFENLLVKKFSEAKINMIQDVTSKVIGLFPTLFNYGSVYIQTAAEVPEIEFEMVPNPEKVIKVLQQLRQEEEQEALDGRVR